MHSATPLSWRVFHASPRVQWLRRTRAYAALIGTLAQLALLVPTGALAQNDPAASFSTDIRPILQRSCQGCHQPASKMSGLDLTTYAGLMAGGAKGPAVVAGDPTSSLVIAYVAGERQPRMPMGQEPLPSDQIVRLREWVAAGAIDDTPEEAGRTTSLKEPPVYTLPPVINAIAYSPDGRLLAVAGYREVLLHDAGGGGLLGRLVGESERIQSLEFSSDWQDSPGWWRLSSPVRAGAVVGRQ